MRDASGTGMTYSTVRGAVAALSHAGLAADQGLFAVRRAFPAGDGCDPAAASACTEMLDALEAATGGLGRWCARLRAAAATAVGRFEAADSMTNR